MSVIAVTGANGFVGRHLVRRLQPEHRLRCGMRSVASRPADWPPGQEIVAIGTIDSRTDWSALLDGVDAVVHLASIAHMRSSDPAEISAVNVDGVRRLAEAAVSAGVGRLVYVSSIGVHGDEAGPVGINELSRIQPHDAYSASKSDAEEAIRDVAATSDLELVIVRPPLVYGPGAPGNFARLLRLVESGMPLPFGRIDNRRSLVSVGNLCDFLAVVATAARAADEDFVICDGEDVSLPELLRAIAAALGRPARVFDMPISFLRALLALLGRGAEFRKLTGNLVVDARKAREQLGWQPPESLQQGLRFAVCSDSAGVSEASGLRK